LEYIRSKKGPTLLLVGKGLTFDSGGISLKPASGMEKMKYDMCGGAAVLAAMQAVGSERPENINVVAVIPATENMPGPGAIKPGDIISQYGGRTVEVVNTDAEGRLILADALAYGVEKYRPDAVVDLATLTGAVVVALGHHRTGLFSNDDVLAGRIIAAAEQSGEPVWRLPLGPEYTEQLKSKVADLKNVGKKGDAGAITAAAFLEEFVPEDVPWAHLDIAGTAWDYTEKTYVPKGPSGIGARLLIELIRSWE
ncbi:MAG TPA: peptidase M17, partial [Thermodesulfobacteriaceae bacterium]|nr:peptidase M17 [Thermodesulfobacteriaceae bacterium]